MPPTALKANMAGMSGAGPAAGGQQPLAEELLQLLSSPTAYKEHPHSVSLAETHISWVFITDRFAYQLKKPVRFGFVDFSTESARLRAGLAVC